MKKKANLTLMFVFISLSIMIILITAIAAPMGVLFSAEMYVAGQDLLNRSIPTINKIHDDTIRNSILDSVGEANEVTQTNIEVSTDLYQYSWILLLVLTMIVLFLYSRQLVEYGQGGFIG